MKRRGKAIPKGAKKIAKARRFHRKRGMTKTTNYVNVEQFNVRHKYCVAMEEILTNIEHDMSDHMTYGYGVPQIKKASTYIPANLKAVCEHPEDGFCGQNPTPEQLQKINAKLSFKVEDKEDVDVDPNLSSEPVTNSDSNIPTRKYRIKIGG